MLASAGLLLVFLYQARKKRQASIGVIGRMAGATAGVVGTAAVGVKAAAAYAAAQGVPILPLL